MERLVSRLGRFWVVIPAGLVFAAWVASGLLFWPSGDDETLTSGTRASDTPAVEEIALDTPPISAEDTADADTGRNEPGLTGSELSVPRLNNPTTPITGTTSTGTEQQENGDESPDVAPQETTDVATADADEQLPANTSTTAPGPANETDTTSTSTIQQVDDVSEQGTTTTSTTVAPTTTEATVVSEPSSPRGRLTGVSLFADSTNSAAQWAANNPQDPRSEIIATRIGSQPIARWFGEWSGDITAAVSNYVNEAAAVNAVPMLVVYNIPDRDCGQHSSGGAANFEAYDAWIDDFAAGLEDDPAIIIIEPDAIALNSCAGSGRNIALNDAVNTIKNSCAQCRVYLDAGHSNWVAPADMASRLTSAGVLNADGFSTNISNYNLTVDEAAYGAQVLAALGNPTGIGQVIDASRNGNGANGEWCDPQGRAVGTNPTVSTGTAHVHAHLWIKVPGEADGCIAAAGTFVPDQAFALATNQS